MLKVSGFILISFLSIFFISCGDEAASDNDSGLTDNETVTDTDNAQENDSVTADENQINDETADETADETVDETVDETIDETIDEIADETIDETIDETTDETIDEIQPDDDAVSGPSTEALACCQEIVKEWWRCEGSFDFDAVDGCVACVNALSTCEEFNPTDESFSCKDECGAVCPPVSLKGDGSGQDRRLIADEYCAFIMDPACGHSAADFSSLGAIDGLDACYDL